MVSSVSPICVRTVPNMVNSFSVSLRAMVLAMAVTAAVSSHEFKAFTSAYILWVPCANVHHPFG